MDTSPGGHVSAITRESDPQTQFDFSRVPVFEGG